MPFYFPEVPFCFPEVSFHLLCATFSKNAFSPANCTFSTSCSELLREIIFSLLLFCFLFRLYIGQFMMSCILLMFTFKQYTSSSSSRYYCVLLNFYMSIGLDITLNRAPTNGSCNDQETMFFGRRVIEHADENFLLQGTLGHGTNNKKNHPQLAQNTG